MHLQIRFTNSQEMKAQQEMLEKVLLSQLGRFEHRLKQVQLYIEDVNGPRGGLDKHCRCVLHVRRAAPIVIRDVDSSVAAMVNRVADRAFYAMSRYTQRRSETKNGRVRNQPESYPEII